MILYPTPITPDFSFLDFSLFHMYSFSQEFEVMLEQQKKVKVYRFNLIAQSYKILISWLYGQLHFTVTVW